MQSRLIEFTPSNRYFASQARLTQVITWVTVTVNLLIILASPRDPGNVYWFLLGTSFGLALLFKGSLGLLSAQPGYSRIGLYLHHQFEKWFPLFQFWIRHILIMICLVALWIQVLDQGLEVATSIHVCLAILFLLLPCNALLLDKSRHATTPTWYRIHEVTRFVMLFAVCAMIGLIAQAFVPIPEDTLSKQVPLRVVLIWTPITLFILSNLIVLLGRVRQADQKK